MSVENFRSDSRKIILNSKHYLDFGYFPTQYRSRKPRSPYLALRQDARDILCQVGIFSDLVWSDWEIVNAFRNKVRLPGVEQWDEGYEHGLGFAGYRDHLIETLQEAGVEIREPITEVDHIIDGLRTLILRK